MMSHPPSPTYSNPFFEFDPNESAFLLRKLREDRYLTVSEISRVRKANPDVPLPPGVLKFEEDRNAGKIKRPGRRKHDNPLETIMPELAFQHYEWLHARLRHRKKTVGLRGWSLMAGKSWWTGTPSERALQMTLSWLDRRGFARNMSVGRLANIISQQRQKVRRWNRSMT